MRPFLIFGLLVFLISSCVSTGYIRKSTDRESGNLTRILHQDIELAGENGRSKGQFVVRFIDQEKKGERPVITVDVSPQKNSGINLVDPHFYLELDGERVKLSEGVGETTGSGLKSKTQHFLFPENMWRSVANTEFAVFLIEADRQWFRLNFTGAQTEKTRQFFRDAVRLSDEMFPTPPPGLKKW